MTCSKSISGNGFDVRVMYETNKTTSYSNTRKTPMSMTIRPGEEGND